MRPCESKLNSIYKQMWKWHEIEKKKQIGFYYQKNEKIKIFIDIHTIYEIDLNENSNFEM